ncbi:hypothetical protein MLD38_003283 [Melastoma candidum]|uniref:Uncharacterized protein n=1 Tax=Melastoma candidum TaxID=119954 RepID=A0ACB9S1B0_9MYRT|nr:hypothetical protein MLD38_003283 [Melastoma candidum]
MTREEPSGNWLLSYFGYTSFPDVGPEQLRTMAKALDVIGDKQKFRILPMIVTVDPQRDKPSHVRAYLREFDPGIIGLTGPVNAIMQMAQEYRVYFKKMEEEGEDYLVASSHNLYLLNPNMEIVRVFGMEYTAEQLAETILTEMTRTNRSSADSGGYLMHIYQIYMRKIFDEVN